MLTPRTVRYAGLLGAVLLAVAAHLGGVRRPWRPNTNVGDLLRGEHGVVMPLAWLSGIVLLTGAWWLGHRLSVPTRWAYVTAGLWLLPFLAPAVLGSRDIYSYACQGSVVATGQDPYAAGLAVLGCPWIDATAPIWRDSPAPYGPFYVLLAGAAAALGGTLAGTLLWLRAFAVAGVLLAAVCLPALARRCAVAPARAVWTALACPLVGVHLVSGAHNDAVMVGLLVAGLTAVAVARSSPRSWGLLVLGGALLGLAVAVKVTALVVLPFAAVVVGSRIRDLLLRGGSVVAAAAGALLAVSAGSGLGFGWVRGLAHSGDSIQWTSPSTAVGLVVNYLGRPFGLHLNAVPVTRVAGIVVLAAVLVVLWWRAFVRTDRHLDPLLAAGLALAATVALSPVFHPWYASWPLMILAATGGSAARWLLAPCAVAAVLALPDGTSLALVTRFPGAFVMTAVVVVVLVRAVRGARAGGRTPVPASIAGPDR